MSQEDELAGESGNIQHQKQILREYAEKNGFPNPKIWADDGYSGVSFDRPGYNEMMAEVEAGNVSTIIVKDHSRLGRNRLVMGYLIEEKFPDYGVRYIAINDSVDTDNADRLMAVVDRYTDIQALTPEIVREFIEKIVVHERSGRWKKKSYIQQVDVYFNFVGRV